MAHVEKAADTSQCKLGKLSLIPRTHIKVERDSEGQLSSDLHMCAMVHVHTTASARTHKVHTQILNFL